MPRTTCPDLLQIVESAQNVSNVCATADPYRCAWLAQLLSRARSALVR